MSIIVYTLIFSKILFWNENIYNYLTQNVKQKEEIRYDEYIHLSTHKSTSVKIRFEYVTH